MKKCEYCRHFPRYKAYGGENGDDEIDICGCCLADRVDDEQMSSDLRAECEGQRQ